MGGFERGRGAGYSGGGPARERELTPEERAAVEKRNADFERGAREALVEYRRDPARKLGPAQKLWAHTHEPELLREAEAHAQESQQHAEAEAHQETHRRRAHNRDRAGLLIAHFRAAVAQAIPPIESEARAARIAHQLTPDGTHQIRAAVGETAKHVLMARAKDDGAKDAIRVLFARIARGETVDDLAANLESVADRLGHVLADKAHGAVGEMFAPEIPDAAELAQQLAHAGRAALARATGQHSPAPPAEEHAQTGHGHADQPAHGHRLPEQPSQVPQGHEQAHGAGTGAAHATDSYNEGQNDTARRVALVKKLAEYAHRGIVDADAGHEAQQIHMEKNRGIAGTLSDWAHDVTPPAITMWGQAKATLRGASHAAEAGDIKYAHRLLQQGYEELTRAQAQWHQYIGQTIKGAEGTVETLKIIRDGALAVEVGLFTGGLGYTVVTATGTSGLIGTAVGTSLGVTAASLTAATSKSELGSAVRGTAHELSAMGVKEQLRLAAHGLWGMVMGIGHAFSEMPAGLVKAAKILSTLVEHISFDVQNAGLEAGMGLTPLIVQDLEHLGDAIEQLWNSREAIFQEFEKKSPDEQAQAVGGFFGAIEASIMAAEAGSKLSNAAKAGGEWNVALKGVTRAAETTAGKKVILFGQALVNVKPVLAPALAGAGAVAGTAAVTNLGETGHQVFSKSTGKGGGRGLSKKEIREKIATLRSGRDVHVKTIEEARELLENMPDLRPATEDRLMPNPPRGNPPRIRISEGFDDPKGTYRGDLINKQDPTGPVHPDVERPEHRNFPHYNIHFPDGEKAAIIIDG
jgi:hypothetical protein